MCPQLEVKERNTVRNRRASGENPIQYGPCLKLNTSYYATEGLVAATAAAAENATHGSTALQPTAAAD